MLIILAALLGLSLNSCKTSEKHSAHSTAAGVSDVPPSVEVAQGFKRFCSGCHEQFVGSNGQIDWSKILAERNEIAKRLAWTSAIEGSLMPPFGSGLYNQLKQNLSLRDKMLAAVKPDVAGNNSATDPSLPLNEIKLPPGFEIKAYANVPGARSMTLGRDGTVYVGTGGLGGRFKRVYKVQDHDGDLVAEDVKILADGLNTPNGVAYKENALYVAEIDRILKFDTIDAEVLTPVIPTSLAVRFPTDAHHGWKFIAFGPDGLLYVPIGAPCNVCDPGETHAAIWRVNADGTQKEKYASGIRNTVGFAWHPETKELWFTENGRDQLGDDIPPDELNRATEKGLHFGFPFCHGDDIRDPQFGSLGDCNAITKPAQKLGPHVAGLGMRFYTGAMFPPAYKNQIFIAEHGSWNRTTKIGYRVTMVRLDENGNPTAYETFASGWLKEDGQRWGRPVDVLVMPDGALLVSDDLAGMLYRISYQQ